MAQTITSLALEELRLGYDQHGAVENGYQKTLVRKFSVIPHWDCTGRAEQRKDLGWSGVPIVGAYASASFFSWRGHRATVLGMLRLGITISAATLGIAVCSNGYGQIAEDVAPRTPMYWATRHFSGLIDTGAHLVDTSGVYRDSLAFVNPDGTTIVEMLNTKVIPEKVVVEVRAQVSALELPGLSMAGLLVPESQG